MPATPESMNAEYEERYRIGGTPAMRRIEWRVIGADYGATSYTTRAQVDRLAVELPAGSSVRLLDIGSGAGWPGIYLGRLNECNVTMTDVPREGLRIAARRMQAEGVAGGVVVSSGAPLPFRNGVFDVVTSSDVLC